jgi:serine/threonine-protein kinase
MSIRPGTVLGTYEILSPLGFGGMGEVYRARDLSLDREVAIKVLAESVAPTRFRVHGDDVSFESPSDSDRMARLEGEAKVLAALHHPNIATLFGLGREGGQVYLAMELVEGENLDERLKRRPLSIEEAIPIFVQVAEGLEAAHEKGINHRDLKPANLMITNDDVVKILDFGLARVLRGGDDEEDDQTRSGEDVTLSYASDQRSRLRGTLGYMSPEQARGRGIDRRSDIWAFGCCLYEALTARRPFRGETVSDTLSEILKGEPRWDKLPAATPPAMHRLLRRCLAKDRHQRLHDIGDARLELEEARSGVEEEPRGAAVGRRGIVVAAGAGLAVGALIVAGLAASAGNRFSPAPESRDVRRLAVSLPDDAPMSFSDLVPFALSPDGRDLVYVTASGGESRLVRRSLGRLEIEPLAGTEGARNPFFSPDGQWVGFVAGNSIKRVALAGGRPVTVCEVSAPGVAAWGPDDTIVFSSWRRGLFRVPAVGGTPVELTTLGRGVEGSESRERAGLSEHLLPEFLPGGEALLFSSFTPPATLNVELWHLGSGERRSLFPGTSARYLAGGRIVFARGGDLWAVDFDLETLTVKGPPVKVLESILHTLDSYAQFAVTRQGDLLYLPGEVLGLQRLLSWVDPDGSVRTLEAEPADYGFPSLSPDGRMVAVSSLNPTSDIWLYDLARSSSTQFTFDAAVDVSPVWARGGDWLVFGCAAGMLTPRLCWKSADGTGGVEPLTASANLQLPSAVTANGSTVIYNELAGDSGWDVWALDLDRDEARVLVRSAANENGAALSPDGRWLAYQSDSSGRQEVYVSPYPATGSGTWQISKVGGQEAVWRPDGKRLFFRGGDSMMAVDIDDSSGFRAGRPEPLFDVGVSHDARRIYDVAPDGSGFVMVREASFGSAPGDLTDPVFVEAWGRELEELLSAR